jgi:hypothetical protein
MRPTSRSHTKPPAVLARVEKMGECASRQSPGLSQQVKKDDFTQDLVDLHQRAKEGICGGAICNSEQPTSQVSSSSKCLEPANVGSLASCPDSLSRHLLKQIERTWLALSKSPVTMLGGRLIISLQKCRSLQDSWGQTLDNNYDDEYLSERQDCAKS